MSNDAIVAITAVVGAVTAALALVLSIVNTIVEWRSRRPPTIHDQRLEREVRMKDMCDILAWPDNGAFPNESDVRLVTKCFVGVPTESLDQEFRSMPALGGVGSLTQQSYVLYWPIWFPHGTPIKEGDHLIVRSPGSQRRFRVVSVFGPYTDELSRDVVARVIRE